MLLETYDFGLEVRQIHLIVGIALGLLFGIAAQISRFCLRRAVAGSHGERGSAAAVWLTGLATAIVGFILASNFGLIDISSHRFSSAELPIAALIVGGLAFGIGMVLTRGCVSRLTVLSATGNLRAATVLLVFAVTAHAALKGVLAPVRTFIGSLNVEAPFASFSDTSFGISLLAFVVVIGAAIQIRRHKPSVRDLVLGAVIGLVAIGGWSATSVLLLDEFDPLPIQTVAFTLPWSETLFWTIASSAIPAGFGVGFVAGVLGGSFLSAATRGELKLQSFESPAQTVRYIAGGTLMGIGGVLAGGCTIGAGLSGVATGSVAALIALVSIAAGARVASSSIVQAQQTPATA